MSVTTMPERPVKKWRVIVFAVVATLMALFFLVFFLGAPALLIPWVPAVAPAPIQVGERWHLAIQGVNLGLLFGGSLIALLWHGERRPALAQFFLLVWLGFEVVSGVTTPGGIFIGIVFLAIFILTYPAPRALFSFSREGVWSLALLALSVLAAICLAPDVWRNVVHGLGATNSSTQMGWLTVADVDILLVLGGVLASAKRPGWKALGILIGISFLYLGAAASTLPTNAGSWGLLGGILAILAGLGFIVATVHEMRRTKKVAQASAPEATNMASAQI